jgi:F-type H+-transporting ATPase subunit gamma
LATLKEIKNRIQSVKSTQKITSAMKMVSSAKLRKAEISIENSIPYKESLLKIQSDLLCDNPLYSSPLMELHKKNQVAILVLSSNSSLCGSFNSNIAKELSSIIEKYQQEKIQFEVIPVGKMITHACLKLDLIVKSHFEKIIDKPEYADVEKFAKLLISLYLSKKYDKIELLYYQYISKSTQTIVKEQFLPYTFDATLIDAKPTADYLFEPNRNKTLDHLIPQILKMKLFQVFLNSTTSEHAARTNSMQIATENADELLLELSLQFNKLRQQSITNELLDIMGGSFK